jgi:hypothetical protein
MESSDNNLPVKALASGTTKTIAFVNLSSGFHKQKDFTKITKTKNPAEAGFS